MSDFAFTLPVGDSPTLRLTLTNADGSLPDFTGQSLTFSAGSVVKTSGAGEVTVSTPTNVVEVAILAGDFAIVGSLSASFVATSGTAQSTWYGSVVITSTATQNDLTTFEKVIAHLGIDGSQQENLLQWLITSSSAWFVSRLGQGVLIRSVVETRDGDGTCRLNLRNWPVNSVTSVSVDGETIPQRTAVDGDGWVLARDGIDLVGYSFTKGTSNVTIAYSAGYASCPDDLEQAVIEHVVLRYRDKGPLTTQSLSGESVTYNPIASLAYIDGVIASSPLKTWPVS